MPIQKTKTQIKREARDKQIIELYTLARSYGASKVVAYDSVADQCDTTRSTVQRITKGLN